MRELRLLCIRALLALAGLMLPTIGSADNSADKSGDNFFAGPNKSKPRKAAGTPVVTIENFKSWTEQQGDTTTIWSSWLVVTRYPRGSSRGDSFTGEGRNNELEDKRKEFDRKVRPDYWKAWAKNIEAEVKLGLPMMAREYDVFRRYLSKDGKIHVNLRHNLDLMKAGRAPIGEDGQPVNVHHVLPLFRGGGNSLANLTPLTATFHQSYSKALHSDIVTAEQVLISQKFRLK